MRGKCSKLGEPCPKVRLSQDRLSIEPFARISLSLSLRPIPCKCRSLKCRFAQMSLNQAIYVLSTSVLSNDHWLDICKNRVWGGSQVKRQIFKFPSLGLFSLNAPIFLAHKGSFTRPISEADFALSHSRECFGNWVFVLNWPFSIQLFFFTKSIQITKSKILLNYPNWTMQHLLIIVKLGY